MARCVVYCRVSTDAQERDGTSLETQERACNDYAESQGWAVVEHVRDSASGYSLERAGMDRVRRVFRDGGAEVVLAFAVDRLSRNQNHIGVLFDEANQAGVKLDFVTEKFEDTAVGRFILAARAFVAEVEREKIVERTQRGKAQRARSGKLPQATGRGIYGYRYDSASGTRHVESREAEVVLEAFERFVHGGSCNGIAGALNSRAVPAFGGGRWYPQTVRRMLFNETYTGRSVYRRMKVEKYRDGRTGRWKTRVIERAQDEWIEIVGATPAIVSRELYLQAKGILDDPFRRSRSQPSRAYPLRGRLRCLACGAPMVGQVLMKGRYSYYRCRHSYGGQWDRQCASRYVATQILEGAVLKALADLLCHPDRIISEARRQTKDNVKASELEAVNEALREVEGRQRRLVRLYTEGDLPAELLEEQRRELSTRRTSLETERQRLEVRTTPAIDLDELRTYAPEYSRQLRCWLESADGDKLELLLRSTEAQVTASRSEAHIRGSIPVKLPSQTQDLVTTGRTSA